MSVEENKAIVLRYFLESHNPPRNFDVIDDLCSLEYGEWLKRHIATVHRAFPDVHYTVEDVVAEGEKVVLRWTARGTHLGELPSRLGPIAPTGKAATATAVIIYHVVDGKIVGEVGTVDWLGVFLQLGVLSAGG